MTGGLPHAIAAHTVADSIAITLVIVATLAVGTWALRFSRTTSDFLVASRTVGPGLNAAAVSGEYLSAASFLGVAGLLLTHGSDMFWYPIGFTAGMLVLLVVVAAPLRRSGAYTLPDFAQARLGSKAARACCSVLAVLIGWLYLAPQFRGAGITLKIVAGTPEWVGGVVVAVVVLLNVTAGGMRSITFVQAFQYWFKLTALALPAVVLLMVWLGDGSPSLATSPPPAETFDPLASPFTGTDWQRTYGIYSVVAALFLGSMGLPHVAVRFYTNPDGHAARRTTLVVLALLGLFYVVPPIYAALGRQYAGDQRFSSTDALILELPRLMIDGPLGVALSALVSAGAFAAFLSTSSGLVIGLAGVLGQNLARQPVIGPRLQGVNAFRVASVGAVVVPLVLVWYSPQVGVAQMVGLVFAVAASTFAPLLVLGIWWRGLTARGGVAGLVVGGLTSVGSSSWTLWNGSATPDPSWWQVLLAQPAAWTVPLAFVVMIGVSLVTRRHLPPHATRFMVRLHTPESLDLQR